MYEYYFEINNPDFNEPYEFIARFQDHFEAAKFIEENETDGNSVIIKYPFYKWIPNAKPFQI